MGIQIEKLAFIDINILTNLQRGKQQAVPLLICFETLCDFHKGHQECKGKTFMSVNF